MRDEGNDQKTRVKCRGIREDVATGSDMVDRAGIFDPEGKISC